MLCGSYVICFASTLNVSTKYLAIWSAWKPAYSIPSKSHWPEGRTKKQRKQGLEFSISCIHCQVYALDNIICDICARLS